MAIKDFGFTRLFGHEEEPDQEVASRAPAVQRRRPEPGTRILIIDDSKTIHVMLNKALQMVGYETLSAYDGEGGLAMLREQRPALVLMDVVMPGISGFQATRQIRKDPDPAVAATPVLMISGNEQPSEELWSTKIGANGFLAKPFDNEVLYDYIETILHSADSVMDEG